MNITLGLFYLQTAYIKLSEHLNLHSPSDIFIYGAHVGMGQYLFCHGIKNLIKQYTKKEKSRKAAKSTKLIE